MHLSMLKVNVLRSSRKENFLNIKNTTYYRVMNMIDGIQVHPVIKRVLIENTMKVSFRKATDERKIIFVNLSKVL